MEILIFICLIISGGIGVVATTSYLYQNNWEMDWIERIACVLTILCCIAGMAVGFCPWYC